MLPRGLEPRTLGLLDLRSDQLSYESTRMTTLLTVAIRRSYVKLSKCHFRN